MIRSLSFKWRLFFLLVLPILALCYLGYNSITESDQMTEDLIVSLHEQDYNALEMILNAENNMHAAQVAAHTLVYTEGSDPAFAIWQSSFAEQVRLAKTQADAAQAIARKYNDAFNLYQHPHSKRTVFENFADFESNFQVWNALSSQAVEKLKPAPVGQRAEGLKMIRSADSSFEAASASIVEISQMLRSKADDVIEAKRAQREEARQTTLYTIGITLLVISLLCLLLVRAITRSLGGTLQIAQRVADGDLRSADRAAASNDEIGKLATAAHNMADSLRGLILQVTELAENVTHSSARMAESTVEIAASTQEIAGELQTVSSGSELTDRGTQEMNTAMGEMTAGIQRIAETSTLVAEASMETAEQAAQGNHEIQQAIRQMHAIREATDRSAGQVQRLGEQSQAIEQIVEVIAGIAAQTNLLALNAAIEAARAGEQGRGFAVVAEEVRKLADQSQNFTAQIAELIGQVREQTLQTVDAMDLVTREVHAGIAVVDSAGSAFQHILQAAQIVAEQIQEITAASEEMSAGSEEVTAAVSELSRIAQDTAGSAATSLSAVERQTSAMGDLQHLGDSLSGLAQELRGALARFQV